MGHGWDIDLGWDVTGGAVLKLVSWNRLHHRQQNTNFLDCILIGIFHWEKCPQFSRAQKWRTLRKAGCIWAEKYATSQLHHTSRAEANKFLLGHVILFKHVYFRQYFAFVCTSCTKEYLTAATYHCQVEVEVKVCSSYLRDYRLQWTPFFRPFPVVT